MIVVRYAAKLLFIIVLPAQAQTLIHADSVMLQPQIFRDSKGFSTCGVRASVVVMDGSEADVYDFSINSYANFQGLAKAGKYRYSHPAKEAAKAIVVPPPIGFWIAAVDQGVPTKVEKVLPSESKGFVLGGLQMESALKAILGISYGKTMQFAVRYKSEPIERVISFSKKMDDADIAALQSCLDGLVERMRVTADDLEAGRKSDK